jgi:hypothetical protein
MKNGHLSTAGVLRHIAGIVATLGGIVLAAQTLQQWRNDGWREIGAWGWFWLGLLPAWLYLFLRRYSVFRKDCPGCPGGSSRRDPPAP